MGTDRVLDLIKGDKRLKYITIGHTHKRFGEVTIEGVTYINASVGYTHEWEYLTFKQQLDSSLIVKEF